MEYPKIERTEFSEIIHGNEIADPYRFMEDEDSRTADWTKANNKLLDNYLEDSKLDYFSNRLSEIVDFDRYSAITQKEDRFFYQKHEGSKSQPSLYYRDGIDGEDQLVMDFSTLSEDGTLAATTIGYSDDGQYVSICLSQSGSDWQEMIIIETETRREVDRLIDVRFTLPAWTEDNTQFFYTKFPPNTDDFDRTSEDGRVFLHTVGKSQSEDIEIFKPEDPQETPSATLSKDKSKLIIETYLSSGMGNKLAIMDRETGNIIKINDEYNGSTYNVIAYIDEQCYVSTNEGAPLNKIIRIRENNLSLETSETIIPEGDNLISNTVVGGEFLFVTYLIKAISVIKRYTLEGEFVGELELPQMGTILEQSSKHGSDYFFYTHTSYPYLPQVYCYNIEENETTVLFDNRANFDTSQYTLKQVFYPSKDGTEISMFIIHPKELELDGDNPCLLWSYGGFNVSLTPGAGLRERYKVRLMIEEGGVYACPNIRGGGEYGKKWHKAGTKENKQNVFDDFIAAAEYLIREGYTSSDKIVSHGGSNGGLLVASTLLQRPNLWGATVAEAGVMDMLRYHKFTFGRYWTGDYGNPDEKDAFQYLLAYSPVHNVDEQEYPPSLFYCADTDTRVVPMHTKKLVAELQYKQKGNAPILIRTETKAGHNFGKPITKVIEETAIMFAFIWQSLDLSIDN